jgi:hypothetical protein
MQQDEEEDQNEVAGWRFHGPEKDGFKRMERQIKESRGLQAYCSGGQGRPRAVASSGIGENIYILWYSFYSSLGAGRGWVVHGTPLPLYPREEDQVHTAQEAEWVSGPVWTGEENRAPPGFDPHPGSSTRSKLLYRQRFSEIQNQNKVLVLIYLVASVGNVPQSDCQFVCLNNQCTFTADHTLNPAGPSTYPPFNYHLLRPQSLNH